MLPLVVPKQPGVRCASQAPQELLPDGAPRACNSSLPDTRGLVLPPSWPPEISRPVNPLPQVGASGPAFDDHDKAVSRLEEAGIFGGDLGGWPPT